MNLEIWARQYRFRGHVKTLSYDRRHIGSEGGSMPAGFSSLNNIPMRYHFITKKSFLKLWGRPKIFRFFVFSTFKKRIFSVLAENMKMTIFLLINDEERCPIWLLDNLGWFLILAGFRFLGFFFSTFFASKIKNHVIFSPYPWHRVPTSTNHFRKCDNRMWLWVKHVLSFSWWMKLSKKSNGSRNYFRFTVVRRFLKNRDFAYFHQISTKKCKIWKFNIVVNDEEIVLKHACGL